jgi:hypothetical protein
MKTFDDLKRYLQVCGISFYESHGSINLSGQKKIWSFGGKSLFDELPVETEVLESDRQGLYAVTHGDGEIYIQGLPSIRKLEGRKVKNLTLFPVSAFKKIREVIKNRYENTGVPLHVHTTSSGLDGLGKAEDYARRCKQLGISSCAITDHGNMAGIITFQAACKKYGVKPIFGQEFYLDDNRHLKGVPAEIKKQFKQATGSNLKCKLIELEPVVEHIDVNTFSPLRAVRTAYLKCLGLVEM